MDWNSRVIQDAAISLYKQEWIKRSEHNASLVDTFLEWQWLKTCGRPDEYVLTVQGREELAKLLTRRVPDWREIMESSFSVAPALRQAFMQRLDFIEPRLTPRLPARLNRRTWQAVFGGVAGASIPAELEARLPRSRITQDEVVRLRANMELLLLREDDGPINCGRLTRTLTEAAIPQRALDQVSDLDGELPYAVMTVENLGAFVDMKVPDHLLLIWAPPSNVSGVVTLLKLLPHYVPHIHFGDLDHSGLLLAEQIARESGRPVKRFIPPFWLDYLDLYAQETRLEGDKGGSWCGPVLSLELLRKLMTRNRWLAQESILLDRRLYEELEKLVD